MPDSALNMAQVERIRQAMLQEEVLETMQREMHQQVQDVGGKVPGTVIWHDVVEAGLQKAGLS